MTDRLDEIYRTVKLFDPDAIKADRLWSYLWGTLAYLTFLCAQALGKGGIADAVAWTPRRTPSLTTKHRR